MSRVQFVRQMLPRICKDFYELEIYHNPNGTDAFDPGLTTSVSTTVIWQTEAGTTVTTGTTHNLSYTPTAGPKVCKATVLAGLLAVTAVTVNDDSVTLMRGVRRCTNLETFHGYGNVAFVFNLEELCNGKLKIAQFNSNNYLSGNVSLLPVTCTYVNFDVNPGLRGVLPTLPLTATYRFTNCVNIGGSLTNLPNVILIYLYGCTGITPASIAHLIAIRDLRVYSMGWNAANVDTVLLSASDAVWVNADHYSYASPSMQIGGTNAAPGGSSGADTTDPLVTPGSGNSNSDWQWDAGKSAHKALTGKAAVYYLTHLATHTWAIIYAT